MSEYRFLSGVYDIVLNPFLSGMRHQILEIAETLKPEKVVDLCGGTGQQLKILRKNGFADLTCVDLSLEMLRTAGCGRNAPDCLYADAAETGLTSSSVDLVIISLALHEKTFDKAVSILAEAHRILKPAAVLIVADYTTDGSAKLFASALIRFIEFLVGGEHYSGYRNYMKKGGLPSLRDTALFEIISTHLAAAGGITVEVWKKI